MAHFAPIAPLGLFEQLYDNDIVQKLGNYHFLLAHDVLDKPKQYLTFYSKVYEDALLEKVEQLPFIILDNSLIELGESLTINNIMRAAEIVNADVVILPDKLGDSYATRDMGYKALAEIDRKYLNGQFHFMVAAQGESVSECVDCAVGVMGYAPDVIRYIGVPRLMRKNLGTRVDVAKALHVNASIEFPGTYKGMHMLGFSDDIEDDIKSARQVGVMGIDSAVPVRLGLENIEISLNLETAPRREDYMDLRGLRLEDYPTVIRNLEHMWGWLKK